MILHIAPDYFNTPIYQRLIEAEQAYNPALDYRVYVCDNHNAKHQAAGVYYVNRSFSNIARLLFFPKQNYLLHDIERHNILKDIQLIHAHTLFSSGYLAYRLYKKLGIPYIVAVRNTDVNVFFKHMVHLRSIGQKIAAHAQKIIFISPAYKNQVIGNYLPEYFSDKSIILPNGIDCLFLQNVSQHLPAKESIRLIYVGRIEKDKNIHTIIQVADRLTSQGQNVSLCLVGQIIDKEYRTAISKRPYITWHNQCPKEDVLGYLRQSDIFIMPSFHETFGLVYAEAMSQGLPVIYTKGQGFDGFFENGAVGYSVEPDNVEQIAERVLAIRNNYTELSNRCVQQVHLFDWSKIAAKYYSLYQDIHATR